MRELNLLELTFVETFVLRLCSGSSRANKMRRGTTRSPELVEEVLAQGGSALRFNGEQGRQKRPRRTISIKKGGSAKEPAFFYVMMLFLDY